MRTRGINLTQGMEFRDKISRSLKFYGGWFSVLFVIAGRNAHAVTFSKWNIETTTGNMIYTFSYKLNIFLVIESKDLICIYYTDLIKIFMIRWREIVKYYAELEGNQKLNTKKDSFWFRPRIQYTLTLSQVSLVRCKHPQILPFNISSYTQTDFPLFRIDRKFFVRFRN